MQKKGGYSQTTMIEKKDPPYFSWGKIVLLSDAHIWHICIIEMILLSVGGFHLPEAEIVSWSTCNIFSLVDNILFTL